MNMEMVREYMGASDSDGPVEVDGAGTRVHVFRMGEGRAPRRAPRGGGAPSGPRPPRRRRGAPRGLPRGGPDAYDAWADRLNESSGCPTAGRWTATTSGASTFREPGGSSSSSPPTARVRRGRGPRDPGGDRWPSPLPRAPAGGDRLEPEAHRLRPGPRGAVASPPPPAAPSPRFPPPRSLHVHGSPHLPPSLRPGRGCPGGRRLPLGALPAGEGDPPGPGAGMAGPEPSRAAVAPARRSLRLLILGGTGFTGPDQVAYAVARGHRVTVFNRGRSEADLPPGWSSSWGTGTPATWGPWRGGSGTPSSTTPPPSPSGCGTWERSWQGKVGHYLFISTLSVYDLAGASRVDEETPTLAYRDGDPLDVTPERYQEVGGGLYGPMKAASEREARRWFGDGPDHGDPPRPHRGPPGRHGPLHLLARSHRPGGRGAGAGGRPGRGPGMDARDLAEWTVRMAEAGVDGGCPGPSTPPGPGPASPWRSSSTGSGPPFPETSTTSASPGCRGVPAGAGGASLVRDDHLVRPPGRHLRDPHPAGGGGGAHLPPPGGDGGGHPGLVPEPPGGAAGGAPGGDRSGEGAGGAGGVAEGAEGSRAPTPTAPPATAPPPADTGAPPRSRGPQEARPRPRRIPGLLRGAEPLRPGSQAPGPRLPPGPVGGPAVGARGVVRQVGQLVLHRVPEDGLEPGPEEALGEGDATGVTPVAEEPQAGGHASGDPELDLPGKASEAPEVERVKSMRCNR
jgi:hypothetical protein